MMKPLPLIALMAALAGCGNTTNPLFETEGHVGGVLPGTEVPSANRDIVRYEPENSETNGGYVRSVEFNRASDTITVDGLAFDGDDTYERADGSTYEPFPTLGGYRVYAADEEVPDFLDGTAVQQIQEYRAIVARSQNRVSVTTGSGENATTVREPRTELTIIRTGGYADFGFGGFVYQRRGGVVLPTRGQAQFEGEYAGLRVFRGVRSQEYATDHEIQYVTGDMRVQMDMVGFGNGVTLNGQIRNRRFYEADGTAQTIDGTPWNGICDGCTVAPTVNFVITPDGDMFDENGEATGEVLSQFVDSFGGTVDYEEGNYYLVIAGDTTDPDDGGEIAGVIVMEGIDASDGYYDGGSDGRPVVMQETGGFILYRDPSNIPGNL